MKKPPASNQGRADNGCAFEQRQDALLRLRIVSPGLYGQSKDDEERDHRAEANSRKQRTIARVVPDSTSVSSPSIFAASKGFIALAPAGLTRRRQLARREAGSFLREQNVASRKTKPCNEGAAALTRCRRMNSEDGKPLLHSALSFIRSPLTRREVPQRSPYRSDRQPRSHLRRRNTRNHPTGDICTRVSGT